MPQIGLFTRTKTGFAGRIRTLTITQDIVLVSADFSNTDHAPDYRVHLIDDDGPEVGAGWKRTGEKAGDYVAVALDDPIFAQPIRANLFRAGGERAVWVLNWTRPSRRLERGE
ncbi:DUF736 domain-containing protein [Komagataeibacter oboediens]|uniref:DUF736 domain-containing protein n=1 Tax=Komagataeibacter oboediens TaxID=65958 RepID=A0ABS5SJZ0_9PROT|nr:DUF736 domain-containing protein [Komagataeibacter oboediens]MBT0674502.1 DUF736 domain-containing protein [Komagataeibacter oboediens]MBT0677722.1 DUF736 domain-containing protein [Komagataeibacter oboediens]